jgi:hypothetical protein
MATTYFDGTNSSYAAASGWICRMRSRFTDSQGGIWVVELIDTVTGTQGGFSWSSSSPKEFALGPDGFTWEMDGKSDTFQVGPISSSVSFDITVDEAAHLDLIDQISGSEDGRFGVAVFSLNGSVINQANSAATYVRPFWFGMVSVEETQWFPYTHPSPIRVKAHCGLALLNDIPYVDDDGSAYEDWVPLGTHLRRIFEKIPTSTLWGYTAQGTGVKQTSASDYSEGIVTHLQWIVDKDKHIYTSTNTPNFSVLSYCGAHPQSFYKIEREEDTFGGTYERTEVASCADVLKNILSVMQIRMVQYGGTFLMHTPWQAGSSTTVAKFAQVSQLGSTSLTTGAEDIYQEIELYDSDFEQASGVTDSFLFPVKQSKSIHKAGGSRILVSSPLYSINVSAANGNQYSVVFDDGNLTSSLATVPSDGTVTIAGTLRIQSIGYQNDSVGSNMDVAYAGMKPVIMMTIKVGDYYLKRDLALSSNSYVIQRNLASNLTFKPHVQTGTVEWTTTPSTYDFVMPFPGTDQEPAVYHDEANGIDVVGGLHLGTHDSHPFSFATGLFGTGTQHTFCEAELEWVLPSLPAQATDHVGVQFSAEMLYKDRDSDTNLTFGPASNDLGGYTPAYISGFKMYANAVDDDADVSFSAGQDTSYSNQLSCESILGDRYTNQSIGCISLNDMNNYGNYSISTGNWVTWGDPTADGINIHQLIARENLFMRHETLRSRKVTVVGEHRDYFRERDRVIGSTASGDLPLYPLHKLVNIIQPGTTVVERKWYITNMAFTARSAAYDMSLLLLDTDRTIGPDEDNTVPGDKFGNIGTPVGGGSGSNSVSPVGIKGDGATSAANDVSFVAVKQKADHITVTSATDLDTMRSDVATNNAKVGVSTDDATKLSLLNLNATDDGIDSITGFTASGSGITAAEQYKLDAITVDGSGNVTAIATSANAIQPSSIDEDSLNQFATTAQLNAIASNTSRITTAEGDIDDLELDVTNILKAVQAGTTGRGIFMNDSKTTNESMLSLSNTEAKLQAGSQTGYNATETSPGVLTMNVAAGPSGSETQFEAMRIQGSTTTGRATLTLPQGTTLNVGSAVISGIGATDLDDVTSVGSGAIITSAERTKLTQSLTDIVDDTTPQLGADLDTNGFLLDMSGDTASALVITGGQYAFRYRSTGGVLQLTGLYFNNVTGQYEFLNGSGDCIFCIKAGSGELSIGDMTGGTNFVMPTARGTNGQVLQIDGSGNVDFSSLDTGDVSEGTNLYYTDARADARISAASVTDLTDVTAAGSGSIITNQERAKLTGIEDGAEQSLESRDQSISGTRNINLGGAGSLKVKSGGSNTLTPLSIEANGSSPAIIRVNGDFRMDSGALSGGILKLEEAPNQGSSAVSLQAPSSLSGDVNFVLPGTDGTSGQVLQTDGSGNLSFATVSGGSGGGMTETPLVQVTGRWMWSSTDSLERVFTGSSAYGATNYYSHSQEPSNSTLRTYSSSHAIDTTSATISAFQLIAYGHALPTDSKKIRVKASARYQNGNAQTFGWSLWYYNSTPTNGTTGSVTIRLIAKSSDLTAGTSSTAYWGDTFTSTTAYSGGTVLLLAEHRSGTLSTTTYAYGSASLFLVD